RLSTTLELRPVLEEVLAAVVAIQDTDMGTLSLADRNGDGLHTAASVGFSQAHLDTVQYVPRGVGACGTALAERRAVIVEDVETDPIFTPYLHVARLAGYRAVYSLPLFTRHGEVLGTITAHFRQPHRPSDRERRLVELYARQAADFIDNARLYRQRSEIARTLQQSLLPPQLPEIPGVELAASYRPAFEGTDVGGDFYDLFEAGEGVWSLIIGDVSGKGVAAAAMTALARHTARAVTPYERTPSGVLARLNEAILQQHQGEGFCTAAYGRLALSPHARGRRPRTLSGQVTGGGERNKIRARLTLALGGHPQPLLLRRDGSVAPIGAPGTLLGQLPDPRLTDRTVELGPEDAVVLYTDGVIEAHVADDLFGQARLISLLGACAGCDAGTITQRIEHAVGQFQGDTPRDDIAILVLRIAPVP
ncbi:MAG: SpoIIE family protein phosphatase, partial [Armatimonadetes bacterium]|nr:SpoIIE family protein phosphatase [Armatimonadota bacterium]